MRGKKDFVARPYMRKAIDVMCESIDERRDDGKACPKVGAVLVRPDGSVETACRGELRDGDHAEFTLLERKNRGNRLDDCMLFATLEPCAPGARSTHKLGCAERIALARIKRVWVGVEDPDPLVARKGIQYLLDAGLEVHMFDPDLQQEIREANEDFLAQAFDRAAAAGEEEVEESRLSRLEEPLANTKFEDLSEQALQSYRAAVGGADEVGSTRFNRGLARLGLMRQEGGRFVPTGFGFLLFDEEPRMAMPQVGLLGTIHYPDGTQEIRTFDGPQVLVPEQALGWLRDKLPNPIDRTRARRTEVNAPFFELVREGIVNALVHRDYGIAEAKCQLVVNPDTVAIWSPGMPVAPITLEQMQSFSAPMLSRNPVLHLVFSRMGMAEERGLGLRSLRDRAGELGLPLPRYTWNNPYLVLTLARTSEAVDHELPASIAAGLNEDDRAAFRFAVTQDSVTSRDLMARLEFDERKVQRVLKKLQSAGLVRRVGKGRATRYEVARYE
jgi:ATP-dependent DNA helicase RecG